MEKKIILIMVSLLVVAALVVLVVMVASGGLRTAGGYTALFNKLSNASDESHNQELALPSSWNEGDKKTVSDQIMDMSYYRQTVQQTSVYVTTLWFVYHGDKWNDATWGTSFRVPDDSHDGWLQVSHGLFSITVSSATNLSHDYNIGDIITLQSYLTININVQLAFGDWSVANIL